MALSAIKQSVVWVDKERRLAREAVDRSSVVIQNIGSSDGWIDLTSGTSTEEYEGDTLSSIDRYTFISSASFVIPPVLLERAAGYDDGKRLEAYYFESEKPLPKV